MGSGGGAAGSTARWVAAGRRRTPRDAGGARDGLLGWRLLRPEQKPASNGFLP